MNDEQKFDAVPDESLQRDLETRAAGIKAIGTWHALLVAREEHLLGSLARRMRAGSGALTSGVNELCAALRRPHARELVDGFGIPEPWLACPLLDGEQARRS